MKGKGFLRITGILMIIGGAASIILCGIIALIYAILAIFNFGGIVGNLTSSVFLIISAILFIVGGIIELITGIIGTRNAARPEKYKACLVWGIIVLVLQVISIIFSLVVGQAEYWLLILAVIFGVIIPILFIIGAVLNRKAALLGDTSIDWQREKLNKQMSKLDKKEEKLERKQNKLDKVQAKKDEKEAKKAQKQKAQEDAEAARTNAVNAVQNETESVQDVVQTEAVNTENISAEIVQEDTANVTTEVDTFLDNVSEVND